MFIFFIFRNFMIVSFIVKNYAIKTLNEIIKKSSLFYLKNCDFEFLKIVKRFSKINVNLTKFINFNIYFFEHFIINSFNIMNDFLKI